MESPLPNMSSNTCHLCSYLPSPTFFKAIFEKMNIRRITKCVIYRRKLNINIVYVFLKGIFRCIRAAVVFAIPRARHRLTPYTSQLPGSTHNSNSCGTTKDVVMHCSRNVQSQLDKMATIMTLQRLPWNQSYFM